MNLLSRRPVLSRKCEASVALECETEMNLEGPPVKAVPEAVRKRAHAVKHASQSSTRIKEKQSADSTQTATWPGSPVDPPEVNDLEVDDVISDPEFDVIRKWKPRDPVIIRMMEDYLEKELEGGGSERGLKEVLRNEGSPLKGYPRSPP